MVPPLHLLIIKRPQNPEKSLLQLVSRWLWARNDGALKGIGRTPTGWEKWHRISFRGEIREGLDVREGYGHALVTERWWSIIPPTPYLS